MVGIERNNINIVLCSPSYKRPNKILTKTRYKANYFVDEGEFEAYAQNNPEESIVAMPKGVQGNISRVRNWIIDYCAKNYDAVVFIDDDNQGIGVFTKSGHVVFNQKELEERIFGMYEVMELLGAKACGVANNQDTGNYIPETPIGFTNYIAAPFLMVSTDNECRFDETMPLKEDYDFFIQNCRKYRKVVRFNNYFYRTLQGKNTGGCADYRTMENENRQLDLLIKKWGTKIVRRDKAVRGKEKKRADYNPIVKIPIKGV